MTLGSKHPSALGRSFKEVWSEIWHEISSRVDSVMNQGKSTWDERLLLFLERNGFPEETYHTFSYSPVFDNLGNISGLFCVVTEETERNIGERRLRLLRELAARTTSGVHTVEEACRISTNILATHANDVPFALVYTLNEDEKSMTLAAVTGIKAGALASPENVHLKRSQYAWPFLSVLETSQSITVNELVSHFGYLPGGPWPESASQAVVLPLHRPGQTQLAGLVIVGVSSRRPLDDNYKGFLDLLAGQLATAIANARAHEEERKRAETLAELDRAKTIFFSNISHEFRTPLTLMLGVINELSIAPEQLSPEQRSLLEVVNRNGLRLQRLVNTLLDFSRIEAGRIEACFEPTDFVVYTADLASNFQSVCEKGGLKFEVTSEPFVQSVFLDRDMWEKIVLNLLSNAFKFTLRGRISISMRQLAHCAELKITDTGIGIPAEEMPRIFERFHRIENVKGRTYEGSGIGLALVQELVKLHGGQIKVESKVNRGTTFLVTLPLGKEHLPREQVSEIGVKTSTLAKIEPFIEEALRWLPDKSTGFSKEWTEVSTPKCSLKTPKNSARILVVDDNADMRQYLNRLLGDQYEVELAQNGVEALAMVQKRAPELIVSDAMMPLLDGFGLLKELRADPKTADIPLIILSARAGEESQVEGMQSGANDYLVKPFSARLLLASISAHLQIARVQSEVRESEARFRALTSATSDVIYRMDPQWDKMHYLEGREFIADTLESSNTWLDKYIHRDDQQLVQQTIKKAIETKSVFELEHRVIQVDGSLGWTHSRAIPIFNKNGEIIEWFGTASDVTSRKATEQALLEASRYKDEFLATLAHELRNPLAPLYNGLQILRFAKGNEQLTCEAQAIMERQLAQMVRLIDDLLDLSRISSGKIKLQKERVELAKVIQLALETSRPIIDAAGHHLSLDLPAVPIYVEVDMMRIAQVFSNLLNNAAKYTERGGSIKLNVQFVNHEVWISVSDTGVGLPSHMLSRVFEIFTQVDQQLGRAQGGLGIGLSLVKQVVEMHGGTVEAKSAGDKKGSEFIVRIPRWFDSYLNEIRVTPQISVEYRRILVVDDNIDVANSLVLMLNLLGHTTESAYDGFKALEMIEAFNPDLILLDIGMPGLNGYETAKKIRKHFIEKKIILIALTGWGQEEDRKRSQEAGFDFHITKPLQPNVLEKLLLEIQNHENQIFAEPI